MGKDFSGTATGCRGHIWGPFTRWGSEIASGSGGGQLQVERVLFGLKNELFRGSRVGVRGAHAGAAGCVGGTGGSVGCAWRRGAWPRRAELGPGLPPATAGVRPRFCPLAPGPFFSSGFLAAGATSYPRILRNESFCRDERASLSNSSFMLKMPPFLFCPPRFLAHSSWMFLFRF